MIKIILHIILDSFLQSEAETRHQFYKILSQPLQTVCSISKKIGGEWLGAKGTVLNMTPKVTSKGPNHLGHRKGDLGSFLGSR